MINTDAPFQQAEQCVEISGSVHVSLTRTTSISLLAPVSRLATVPTAALNILTKPWSSTMKIVSSLFPS